MPFEDGDFDLVYCKQVLEHVRLPEPLLAEVRRVLAPGGWFAGSTSQLEPYHSLSLWNYTPVGFLALLEQAGLRPRRVRPGIDGLTLIAWRLAGNHRCFHRWWGRESPLNRALNAVRPRAEGRPRTPQCDETAVLRPIRVPRPSDMTISEQPQMGCAPHDPANLLDRLSRESTLEAHYRQHDRARAAAARAHT